MVFLFLYIFRNHGPDNTHGPVNGTTKRPPEHGLRERGRKGNAQTRDRSPYQPNKEDEPASTPLRISNTTPRNGRRKLGGRKRTLEDTGLSRNVGIGEGLVKGFELVEHVRLQRRNLQKVKHTTQTEQGQLLLARQRHPCHGARRRPWGRHLDPVEVEVRQLLALGAGAHMPRVAVGVVPFERAIPQGHCTIVVEGARGRTL